MQVAVLTRFNFTSLGHTDALLTYMIVVVCHFIFFHCFLFYFKILIPNLIFYMIKLTIIIAFKHKSVGILLSMINIYERFIHYYK